MLEEERKSQNEWVLYNFGNRLKKYRKERNLTQKQLSMKLGTKISTYANWEQGRRAPGIYDIWNLIITLEIDANELFNNIIKDD